MNLTVRFLVVSVVCASILVIAERPAIAQSGDRQDIEDAQALYLEGMDLYRTGKYRAAIERFEEAHRKVPSPTLLYNVGRSYEALGETDEAMRQYLRCASSAKASEKLKQKAIRRVQIIENARRRSAAAPPDPAPKPLTTPPVTVSQASPGPSFVGTSKWISMGLSLGLLGGGGTLLYLGLSDESELDDARTAAGQVSSLTRTEAQDLAGRAEDRKLTGMILVGAGAAMAVTSLIMFLVDGDDAEASARRDESASDGISFSATPLPDGAIVGLSTGF